MFIPNKWFLATIEKIEQLVFKNTFQTKLSTIINGSTNTFGTNPFAL